MFIEQIGAPIIKGNVRDYSAVEWSDYIFDMLFTPPVKIIDTSKCPLCQTGIASQPYYGETFICIACRDVNPPFPNPSIRYSQLICHICDKDLQDDEYHIVDGDIRECAECYGKSGLYRFVKRIFK